MWNRSSRPDSWRLESRSPSLAIADDDLRDPDGLDSIRSSQRYPTAQDRSPCSALASNPSGHSRRPGRHCIDDFIPQDDDVDDNAEFGVALCRVASHSNDPVPRNSSQPRDIPCGTNIGDDLRASRAGWEARADKVFCERRSSTDFSNVERSQSPAEQALRNMLERNNPITPQRVRHRRCRVSEVISDPIESPSPHETVVQASETHVGSYEGFQDVPPPTPKLSFREPLKPLESSLASEQFDVEKASPPHFTPRHQRSSSVVTVLKLEEVELDPLELSEDLPNVTQAFDGTSVDVGQLPGLATQHVSAPEESAHWRIEAQRQRAKRNLFMFANGLHHRNDVRFDILEGPYSGVQARFTKPGNRDPSITPRKGSDPVYWRLLDGVPLSPRPRRSPSPPNLRPRSTTAPPRLWGLDGSCDDDLTDELLFEDEGDRNWEFVDDPNFVSDNDQLPSSIHEQVAIDRRASCSRPTLRYVNHPLGSDGISMNSGRRQVPIPSNQQQQQGQQQQQQQQQQANGLNNAIQNVNMHGGLQHAGYQMDINYLWSVVQELSTALEQNRAQTASIISRVQQLRNQSPEEESNERISQQHVNGDLNGDITRTSAREADLKLRLHSLTQERDALQADNAEYSRTMHEYEAALNVAMDKIRNYAYEHTQAIIATHKHYAALLEHEREANLQLRLEHGEWQKGLGRAAENARMALRTSSEEMDGLEMRCRELRTENRVLRRLAGWAATDDNDSDD